MEPKLSQLVGCLEEELAAYDRLLELAGRKKKLLLERFSTELTAIVSREEQCVNDIIDLVNRRRDLLREISGKEVSDIESAISTVADSDARSNIWILTTKLRDIASEIRAINEENQKLLEQALELTQHTIQLITKLPNDVVYSPPGTERKKGPVSALFDKKV